MLDLGPWVLAKKEFKIKTQIQAKVYLECHRGRRSELWKKWASWAAWLRKQVTEEKEGHTGGEVPTYNCLLLDPPGDFCPGWHSVPGLSFRLCSSLSNCLLYQNDIKSWICFKNNTGKGICRCRLSKAWVSKYWKCYSFVIILDISQAMVSYFVLLQGGSQVFMALCCSVYTFKSICQVLLKTLLKFLLEKKWVMSI